MKQVFFLALLLSASAAHADYECAGSIRGDCVAALSHVEATVCAVVDMGNGFSCVDCGEGCGVRSPSENYLPDAPREQSFTIIDTGDDPPAADGEGE